MAILDAEKDDWPPQSPGSGFTKECNFVFWLKMIFGHNFFLK